MPSRGDGGKRARRPLVSCAARVGAARPAQRVAFGQGGAQSPLALVQRAGEQRDLGQLLVGEGEASSAARGRGRLAASSRCGTWSSEQDGATIRSLPEAARLPHGVRGSAHRAGRLRQTLRPSTRPSESQRSRRQAASTASSCRGARARSRCRPATGRAAASRQVVAERAEIGGEQRCRPGAAAARRAVGRAIGLGRAGGQVGDQAGFVDLHPGGAGLGEPRSSSA